jgi:hypothetical protein
VTDIFFSYRSADRERVRPIRDALAEQGFAVFWDQEVPAGVDWDSWIRQHLAQSKCALVFWSASSVASDNVRHEATIAKHHGKLIQVLLEPLTVDQFPMGLYTQQAANLADWKGDFDHAEWRKLRREIAFKLTPAWVLGQINQLEAELVAERARREAAEGRDRMLQAQISKEVQEQLKLKRERDQALEEVDALRATVEKLTRARPQPAEPFRQIREPSGGRDAPVLQAGKLFGMPSHEAQPKTANRQKPAGPGAVPTKGSVSRQRPSEEQVPGSIDHIERNVFALFRTTRGVVVRLRDERALAPVNGKYQLFSSVEAYRQFAKDHTHWDEITNATEKRNFFAEARVLLEQVNDG